MCTILLDFLIMDGMSDVTDHWQPCSFVAHGINVPWEGNSQGNSSDVSKGTNVAPDTLAQNAEVIFGQAFSSCMRLGGVTDLMSTESA